MLGLRNEKWQKRSVPCPAHPSFPGTLGRPQSESHRSFDVPDVFCSSPMKEADGFCVGCQGFTVEAWTRYSSWAFRHVAISDGQFEAELFDRDSCGGQ